MLHKLKIDSPHLIGFRWEGHFDKKAFREAVDVFLPELDKRERFNIYMEVTNIEGVEVKALWLDVKFSLKHLGEYRKKIDKIALVSDESWIRNFSEIAYAFIPDIRLKSFTFSETEAALAFVDSL